MIYLFVAVLGLCCCAIFPLVAASGHVSLAVVPGFVTAVASLVEHRLQAQGVQQVQHVGSVVVAPRLSCSEAYGIFPDQGSNPCPWRWQVDSLPLSHKGSPPCVSVNCASYIVCLVGMGYLMCGILDMSMYCHFQQLMANPWHLRSTQWENLHYYWLCISLKIKGEGNGNPLQYSCLENHRDRGA